MFCNSLILGRLKSISDRLLICVAIFRAPFHKTYWVTDRGPVPGNLYGTLQTTNAKKKLRSQAVPSPSRLTALQRAAEAPTAGQGRVRPSSNMPRPWVAAIRFWPYQARSCTGQLDGPSLLANQLLPPSRLHRKPNSVPI